jgi:hypothetical protein
MCFGMNVVDYTKTERIRAEKEVTERRLKQEKKARIEARIEGLKAGSKRKAQDHEQREEQDEADAFLSSILKK